MKQDVLLDQGQPSSQPAGTKTSFPPPDTEQGSEAIKTYLWSSCYKAGIVMQKRGKKPTRAVYCIPGEATHIKIKRKQQQQGEQSLKSHLTAPPVPGLLGSQCSCSSHLPGVCVLGCSVSIPFFQEQNKMMTISSTRHPSSSPSF